MKNKNTTEALIKALNVDSKIEDCPPKGWITASNFAKEINRSLSHTSKILREGIVNKVVEVKVFRVLRDGVFRCVPHYNLMKKRSIRPVRSKRMN